MRPDHPPQRASSSGKTTLVRALRGALPDPWLEIGIDRRGGDDVGIDTSILEAEGAARVVEAVDRPS